MSQRTRSPVPPSAVIAAGAAVALCALPVAALVAEAPWSAVFDELTTHELRTAMWLSLVTSVAAAAVCVALGVPLAWVLARSHLPGRRLLRALAVLPMVLPPVVGGVALLLALGRRSFVGGWLYDFAGVRLPFTTTGAVVAQAFVALPFLVLAVEGGLRAIEPRYEDAARTLGASRWVVFFRVTLPLARPSLVAGAVLAWARALGEFGATITFAGSVPGATRTLPLAVYAALERDLDAAVATSLPLVAVSALVLVALRDRWLVP